MDKSTEKDLDRSIFLVVFLSYMALCTTNRFTMITLLFPIAALVVLPFTRRLEVKTHWFTKFTGLVSVAFLILLPMYIQTFGLVNGVIALFMYIQLHSLIHKRQVSTYLYILMMSFFLFIATLVLSPSPFIGVLFIAMVCSIVSSLLLIDKWHHLSTGTLLPNHKTGWESVQLGTQRLARTRRKRSWALSSAIFCVTLLLFMFFPRTEAGIFGASIEPERAQSGLDLRARFDIVGTIAGNADYVMNVKFLDADGGVYNAPKYWRAKPLHKYTPQGWELQGLKTIASSVNRHAQGYREFQSYSRGKTYRARMNDYPIVKYEVDFAKDKIPYAPLLSTVVSVTPTVEDGHTSAYWTQDRDFSIQIDAKYNERFVVVAQPITPTEDQLMQATDFGYADMIHSSDYQLLTEHNLEQRTLDLVEELTAEETALYAKIKALERHLTSSEFYYTLTVPELDATHPIDNFIHDVKQGHCEIYASALTLMVRSLGVPARTVSGYTGGMWNELDSSYTITKDMAHLWLEVYFPEYGWIIFDPTPSREDPEMTRLEKFQARAGYYITRMQNFWLKYIIAYKPKFQLNPNGENMFAFVGNLFSAVLDGSSSEKFSKTEHLKAVLMILSPLLLILALVHLLKRMVRHQRSNRQLRLTEEQKHAREMYLNFIQKLSKLGVNINNLTAEELLEQLTGLSVFPPEQVEEITEFLLRYHEVRFGKRVLHEAELQKYSTMIKQLRNQPAG